MADSIPTNFCGESAQRPTLTNYQPMSSPRDRARKAPDDSEPTRFTPDQSRPRIEGPMIPLCLPAGHHCCSDSLCSSVSQARALRRWLSAHNQQLQLLVDSQQQFVSELVKRVQSGIQKIVSVACAQITAAMQSATRSEISTFRLLFRQSIVNCQCMIVLCMGAKFYASG